MAPNDVCRVPETPNGRPVHRATVYLPHHSPPLGSALRTASNTYPTNTRNQLQLLDRGQEQLISRAIGFGPNAWQQLFMEHKHRTQFLRTVSMRQPTMYSYMASHRYLYQIVFTHLALNSRTCSHTSNSFPMNHTPPTHHECFGHFQMHIKYFRAFEHIFLYIMNIIPSANTVLI